MPSSNRRRSRAKTAATTYMQTASTTSRTTSTHTKNRRPSAAAKTSKRSRVDFTLRLPPEMLSHTISFLPGLRARLTAARVCARWRQIIMNDPTLWTHINLYHLTDQNLFAEDHSKHCPLVKFCRHSDCCSDLDDNDDSDSDVSHCPCGCCGCDDTEDTHCSDDVQCECAIESGNLHQLPILLPLSGTLPIHLKIKLFAHADWSTKRSSVLAALSCPFSQSITPPTSVTANSRLPSHPRFLSYDIAENICPMSRLLAYLWDARDRVASLAIYIDVCNEWLDLLPLLPPMPILRRLSIRANNFNGLSPLPHLLELDQLSRELVPQAQSRFPVLTDVKFDMPALAQHQKCVERWLLGSGSVLANAFLHLLLSTKRARCACLGGSCCCRFEHVEEDEAWEEDEDEEEHDSTTSEDEWQFVAVLDG